MQKRLSEPNSKWKKRGLNKKAAKVKMGHGGTLDPLATGVLIIGVGSGTKSLQTFLDCTKTYETVVLFGADTDSYDRTGRILSKKSYDHITRESVEKALGQFRGKFEQIPPLYSALKMEGKPLYEYAREGKPIPREIVGREVEVTDLELLEWYEPGTHPHRWPTDEAEQSEKNLAEQVWRAGKQQATSKKMTPDEAEADLRAATAHESLKRKFDQRQDELVREIPNKHKRWKNIKEPALMSGALGQLPSSSIPGQTGKGSNLVSTPSPDAPLPWSDKGPPAARIRLTVTSGFYVRSFCHDLGAKVGSAAMMAELERSRQGAFALGKNCLEYGELAKGEKEWAPKVSELLADWKEKNPEPPKRQDAFRNDRNQRFSQKNRPETPANGEPSADRQPKKEQSEGSEARKRRNSSSGDEAEKPAAKTARVGEQSPNPEATAEKPKEDDSEWDGIKD